MATNIYITDEIKGKLDEVAEADMRSLIDELDYLVSRRIKEQEQENSE